METLEQKRIAELEGELAAFQRLAAPWINDAVKLVAFGWTGPRFIGGVCLEERDWRALAALRATE